MSRLIDKIRRAPWVLKQPLTRVPESNLAKISDLFIWRHSEDWKTSFELLNISGLFGENESYLVEILFFDMNGKVFFTHKINIEKCNRQILNISKILTEDFKGLIIGKYGTFAIFHSKTPKIVVQLKSFITERGYISYKYKNAPLYSYTHGNLDAIEKTNNTVTSIGGISFLPRKYCLQYQLLPNFEYDIALTNPCSSARKVVIKVISFNNQTIVDSLQVLIKPKASFVHSVKDLSTPSRVVIYSKMIMARPIVFTKQGGNMDVFHG